MDKGEEAGTNKPQIWRLRGGKKGGIFCVKRSFICFWSRWDLPARPQLLFVTGPHVPQQTTASLSSARHLRGQLMPFRSTRRGRERARKRVGKIIYLLKQELDNSLAWPNSLHMKEGKGSLMIWSNCAPLSSLLFLFIFDWGFCLQWGSVEVSQAVA